MHKVLNVVLCMYVDVEMRDIQTLKEEHIMTSKYRFVYLFQMLLD